MATEKKAVSDGRSGQIHVSNDDFVRFFEAHFADTAVANFQWGFMNPDVYAQYQDPAQQYDWGEDDDGLGYYEDGVKRTLTDEEIEFFRQSELRELRQQQSRPHAAASKPEATSTTRVNKSVNKKSNKRNGKNGRREPKPDLRKRTWDVVDAGLDTLNYD
ncbi:hypothetical protein O9K51_04078 [Purpureocillium lavendulum]|uniref:Uncharacterized protein n=1 Tax=Purpureocillium lavendulum TaxID=1247861 RepID=A0AB34FX27_9HYPO|nr:hypothetical protein O9K51_04078 [Purpureocillium lavendulum]